MFGWLLVVACGHRLTVQETRWATPQGDLRMACALDTCNLSLQSHGRPTTLARDLWTFDPAASLTEPRPNLWLLEVTEGDACPSMYRLVCPAIARVSGSFGNCNEIASIGEGPTPFIRFDAFPEADRHARVYRLDPTTCERLEIPAGD